MKWIQVNYIQVQEYNQVRVHLQLLQLEEESETVELIIE